MSRKERISKVLSERFFPSTLLVEDVSNAHHGHPENKGSSETHFKVTIHCEDWGELSLQEKHRAIYQILDKEFSSGLHALEIQTN